jgi:predicted DNA-binding transcriptional regulator YafY
MSPADRDLARLLNLLPRLARREGRPLDEICTELGIGRAALLADLEGLSRLHWGEGDAGEVFDFWVEEDRLHVHTSGLLERPVRLVPQEWLALRLGAERLRAAGLADWLAELEPVLAEIGRHLGSEPAAELEPLQRHLQVQRDDDTDPDHLQRVIAAREEGRRLRIGYWSRGSDRHRVRLVDPLAVRQRRGVWYLAAFDHDSGEQRVFRLDRLTALEETAECVPPAEGDGAWPDEAWGQSHAEIRLRGWLASWARDEGWHGLEGEGEAVIWRPAFDEPASLARALLPLLGLVEVLGPRELRRELGERVRELLATCRAWDADGR